MTPEELGKAIGTKMAEGYEFIYNLLSKPVTFDESFAAMIEKERMDFFEPLIPLLKQMEQLEDESYEECGLHATLSFTEIPNIEEKEEKLYAVAEEWDEDMDADLMMNLASFMWIIMLLDIKEMQLEDAEGPDLLGFIGY